MFLSVSEREKKRERQKDRETERQRHRELFQERMQGQKESEQDWGKWGKDSSSIFVTEDITNVENKMWEEVIKIYCALSPGLICWLIFIVNLTRMTITQKTHFIGTSTLDPHPQPGNPQQRRKNDEHQQSP